MKYGVKKTTFGKEIFYEVRGPEDRTVEEISQFLITLRSQNCATSTVRAYAYDLALLHEWLDTQKLGLLELDKYKLHGFIRFQKDLNPRSINRRLQTAISFYKFHMKKELPTGEKYTTPAPFYKGQANPWMMGIYKRQKVQAQNLRLKVKKKLIQPLTPEEVNKFVDHIKIYRDLAMVKYMWRCGLRSQEVLNITFTDINTQQKELRVRGKGEKQRLVPIPDDVLSVTQKYIHYERPRCSTAHLFVVLKGPRRGHWLTSGGLRLIFRYLRKKSGVHHANPHRFRHTFATDMVKAGVSLEVLRILLGHDDIRQSSQYVTLDMRELHLERERAEKRLKEIYGKRESTGFTTNLS